MSARARILVVDDEKLIRWSVGERLARKGHDAVTAETGEQAIERIAATRPDLVLLDLKLPGIDGLETLTRALELDPDLVVVMMSAHGTIDLAVQAMKQGAVDFLVKPFESEHLESAVERGLAAARARHEISAFAAEGRGEEPASALLRIIGASPAMQKLRSTCALVGASDAATALIQGESGVGKELAARAIHAVSRRADFPFVHVNCTTLPEQLLESELFGHERGAFTDARVRKRGLFETARGGTVLLDEIGDMPFGGQAKLLQLIEQKTFRRVGGLEEIRADVRLIAATNADLGARVADGRFRQDLFFRLNVVRIDIPPLRGHPEDLLPLAAHFTAHFNRELGRKVSGIAPDAMAALVAYAWPGNVRELRNVIERALILHPGIEEIRTEHLSADVCERRAEAVEFAASQAPTGAIGLEDVEKQVIAEALEKCRGNQSEAARMLRVTRDTLRYRMKKHGLLS